MSPGWGVLVLLIGLLLGVIRYQAPMALALWLLQVAVIVAIVRAP